ncbi:MAG: response regulator [Bacteriovoracales bacterium]
MGRIIVVDDETDLFPVFKIKFRKEIDHGELQFQFFTNGPEILSFMEKNPESDINACLIDLFLPGMSGIEVTKHLKSKYPKLKVYIFSASSQEEIKKEVMASGADNFFPKPLNFNEIKKFLF